MMRRLLHVLFCGFLACLAPVLSVAAKEKDRPARPLTELKAEFPPELNKEGLGGAVTVEFVVEADGTVNRARTVGTPDPRLSVLAELAVARVRFEPAIVKGKPARYGMTARVDFDALRAAAATEPNAPNSPLNTAATPSLFTSALKFSDGPIAVPKNAPAALPGDKSPRLIKEVPAKYPLKLRVKGVTGHARVSFVVDATGAVREAKAIESTHPDFAKAAVEAVKQFVFEPGEKRGVKVNTRMQLPVYFQLQDPPKKSPATTK